MAKKVIASLKKSTGKDFAKVIKTERSPKTGAYVFKETIVATDLIEEFLAQK